MERGFFFFFFFFCCACVNFLHYNNYRVAFTLHRCTLYIFFFLFFQDHLFFPFFFCPFTFLRVILYLCTLHVFEMDVDMGMEVIEYSKQDLIDWIWKIRHNKKFQQYHIRYHRSLSFITLNNIITHHINSHLKLSKWMQCNVTPYVSKCTIIS